MTFVAVSYTHLDVYKRQEKNNDAESHVLDDAVKQSIIKDLTEKAGGKGKKTLSYTDISNRLGDIELDKDQMDEIYAAPVSYTHLDVYKRQLLGIF